MLKTTNIILLSIILIATGCSKDQHGHDEPKHDSHKVHDHGSKKHKDHDHGHKKHDDHKGHDHADHKETSNAGKHLAVTKAVKEIGIQLSAASIKAIKLKTAKLSAYKISKTYFNIPKTALIYYEDKALVYIKRFNWFMQLDARIISKTAHWVTVNLKGIRANDQLVIAATAILRLAYLEAFGASGHGHSH